MFEYAIQNVIIVIFAAVEAEETLSALLAKAKCTAAEQSLQKGVTNHRILGINAST